MKQLISIIICTLCLFGQNSQVQAQSNIGINTAIPDASSILDITHNSRGLLIPRLPLIDVNDVTTIASPALSLLIFNTATAGVAPNNVKPGFYYFNGTKWVGIGTGTAWDLLGNAGTTASTNFVGTTDNTSLRFRTNNMERMIVDNTTGNVGIGLSNPIAKLHVSTNRANNSAVPIMAFDSVFQTGTSIFGSTPGIGFNYHHSTTNPQVIKGDNYAGEINFPPAEGKMYFKLWNKSGAINTSFVNTTLKGIPMVIDSNLNVGIGTTTPASKLHVLDGQITQEFTTNVSHSMIMKNPSGRNWQLYHLSPTDGSAPNGFMFEHFDGTSWQRRVTIDQTGNMGIGNNSPLFKLHVQGGRSMFTANSDANVVGVMYDPSTYPFYIGATNVLNTAANTIAGLRSDLVFTEAGGSERMRIVGANGNVGINTTTPTEKLDIVGSIKIADGSEGAGKVLTSDATGKGTWQSPSALANYPYQSIGPLPIGANCPPGGSYSTGTITLPAGIYNFIHYSCDGQLGAATSGHNVSIDVVTGSGDATGTYHNFINGSTGCGHYYTGVLRCYTPCTVRKTYISYSGSSFNVPGANAEQTVFIKIL
jgi:hypothetical protein